MLNTSRTTWGRSLVCSATTAALLASGVALAMPASAKTGTLPTVDTSLTQLEQTKVLQNYLSTAILTQAGNGRVLLDWATVPNASGYKVETFRADTGTKVGSTLTVSNSQATVTSLANGTAYEFSVTAVVDGVDTPVGSTGATPMPVAPQPSKAPTLTSSTRSTLTVTLAALSSAGISPITGYQVRFTPVPSGDSVFVSADPQTLRATATDLVPFEDYRVEYAGVNEVDGQSMVGPYSPALTAIPAGAAAPQAFRVSSETNKSVTLRWNPVEDATKYTVFYRASDGSSAEKSLSTVAATSTSPAPTMLKVTGLDNNQPYSFQVAATSTVGTASKVGDRSVTVSATAVSPAIPSDLRVQGLGSGKVFLDWNPVSAAEGYYLKAEPVGTTLASYEDAMEAIYSMYAADARAAGVTLATNANGEDVNHVYAWNGRGLSSPPTQAELQAVADHRGLADQVNAFGQFSDVYLLKQFGYWPTENTQLLPVGHDVLVAEGTDGGVCWVDLSAASRTANCEGVKVDTSALTPAPVKIAADATDALKVVSGLTNGAQYRFRVATMADGVAGDYSSHAASVLATPAAVPGTTNPVKVAVTQTSISVKWNAPAAISGVAPADRYRVTYTPSNGGAQIVREVNGLTDQASGLTTGVTYTISLEAGNAAGFGMTSAVPLVLVASDKPGAVRNPTIARSGDGTQVTLSWSFPDYTGGTSIKNYTVTPKQTSPAGTAPAAKTVSDSSVQFTGLDPDADYTFTISANTDAGAGAAVTVGSLAIKPVVTADAAYSYDEQLVSFSWAKGDDPKLSYQAQAVQIPRGTSSTTIVLPATQSCDATTCTAVFDKFADNINGEAWSFRVRTTDNVYSTSSWTLAPYAAITGTTTILSDPVANCPAGLTLVPGTSVCRETAAYTYYEDRRWVDTTPPAYAANVDRGAQGPECPWGGTHNGGGLCVFPPSGYWTGNGWVKNAPPAGWYDDGTQYVHDEQGQVYTNFSLKAVFPWTVSERASRGVVNFLADGLVQGGGSTGNLGRCPGSVTTKFTGLGGSTPAQTFNLCN